jgi:3-oxoacyl-[acyl-carrier-protein] synthase-1
VSAKRIAITGAGAICGAGSNCSAIWETVRAGRIAAAPIAQFDSSHCPVPLAAEVADFNPRALVEDRKIHKLLRRTDFFGLYAAGQAIAEAGLVASRESLDAAARDDFSDRTGVYVGSCGSCYQNQYDFLPLLTAADGDAAAFGRLLAEQVNPMWLLRSLPNNVLCHIGIRYTFKGPNACITNHAISGALALIEAAEAVINDEADRVVAVGHDAPIEPQTIAYFHALGLLADAAPRSFDTARNGTMFGEGAGALVCERESSARARDANIIGYYLGGGCSSEAKGLLAIREDGDGPARAIEAALKAAGLGPSEVGMIVAHGNGSRSSDASEAAAILRVFGSKPPPVTAFKWCIGHTLAAAGTIETALALECLARGEVPGIATLREIDPAFAELPASASVQKPRSDVALVIARGFAAANAALIVRCAAGG